MKRLGPIPLDIRTILIAGLLIRLAICPFFADSNDFPYWTSVVFDIKQGDGLYQDYDLWYPPVWGYVLSMLLPFMDLFNISPSMELCEAIPGTNNLINEGWLPSIGAIVIIKMPLIAADIANGYLVYRIAKRITDDEDKSLKAAMLWTFCPLTIWVSAGQGQFETLSLLFVLIGTYALLSGSYFLCGISMATATLTKITPSLAIFPMLALILVNRRDRENRTKNAAVFMLSGMLMTFVILLPHLINGEMQFVTSFLGVRLIGHNPLPTGFDGSLMMAFDPMRYINPSGSNVSAFSAVSFLLCLILTVFILAKKQFTEKQTVLLISACMCSLLMWITAPGYVQYYVTVVGVLAVCYVIDRRFGYLVWAVATLAMISMFATFTHAYPLIELGLIDAESLISIYDSIKEAMYFPEMVSTTLKFVPVLIAVYLAVKMSTEVEDE